MSVIHIAKLPSPWLGGRQLSHWTHQHTYFHLSPVAATLCGILQFLSATGSRTPEAGYAESSTYAHTELLLSAVVRPYRVAELGGMEREQLFMEEENTEVSVGSPIFTAY